TQLRQPIRALHPPPRRFRSVAARLHLADDGERESGRPHHGTDAALLVGAIHELPRVRLLAAVLLTGNLDAQHDHVRSRLAKSGRSEEHTSELQSRVNTVCRL